MNKVILVGRLTADPELRTTNGGISTCRFTVAADRKFADKNTGERQADFITCVAWRQTAEFVSRYFSKGKMIVVEGSLRNNNYQDKIHADVTHYSMDVLVDNVEFCGGKNDGGNVQNTQNTQNTQQYAQAPQQPKDNPDMSYGSVSEFEEILSDGDVPF